MNPWRLDLGDDTNVLAVIDHASNHVPLGIELGIDPDLLQTHIGWDIGAAALAGVLGYPAFHAAVSRLVVDLNRSACAADVVPRQSDGTVIPGNSGDMTDRLTLWHDYHDALAACIAARNPHLLVSIHSFTPRMTTRPAKLRPWQIGVLYNEDDRAARLAIALLGAAGVIVGDQQPYSGKMLNATMNRHAEGTGTPYLGIEVRQDLIADPQGVRRWAGVLRPVIEQLRTTLP